MKWRGPCAAALMVCTFCASAFAANSNSEAEQRVLNYIRHHIQPGQPLRVSELYSKVFTQPEEREALDKFYRAFFRIPLFIAGYQQKYGSPPSLETIAEQFDLSSPKDADVLLRVMEDDPRVPHFITRDKKTGRIIQVDVSAIQSDPKFGRVMAHQLGGWEGLPAPEFNLPSLQGGELDLQSLRGKRVLLYVWFTGCPPCMKETPELAKLDSEFRPRGLVVVGANADNLLRLGYDDAVRRRYMKQEHVTFPVVHWTRQSDSAYGNIAIFPTLFLIGPRGTIAHHWVGYTEPEQLRRAIEALLAGGKSSGTDPGR